MPDEQAKHGHETSDASIRNLLIFGAGLALVVIAGLVVSRVVFRYFVGHQGLGPPASPFENVRTLPPEPRLQVTAPMDLKQYKAAQDGILNSYGWVDRQAGRLRRNKARPSHRGSLPMPEKRSPADDEST